MLMFGYEKTIFKQYLREPKSHGNEFGETPFLPKAETSGEGMLKKMCSLWRRFKRINKVGRERKMSYYMSYGRADGLMFQGFHILSSLVQKICMV